MRYHRGLRLFQKTQFSLAGICVLKPPGKRFRRSPFVLTETTVMESYSWHSVFSKALDSIPSPKLKIWFLSVSVSYKAKDSSFWVRLYDDFNLFVSHVICSSRKWQEFQSAFGKSKDMFMRKNCYAKLSEWRCVDKETSLGWFKKYSVFNQFFASFTGFICFQGAGMVTVNLQIRWSPWLTNDDRHSLRRD